MSDQGIGWQPELDELARRRELAEQLGGPERVERLHATGRLTVRERIDTLVDKASFREFSQLQGHATYDDEGRFVGFTPKPAVAGTALIDGRKVVVAGGDATVKGGSASAGSMLLGGEPGPTERALAWQLPLVRLLDSAGGSVKGIEDIGRTYLPDGNSLVHSDVALLEISPVVSAVMGSVAGGPAVAACLSHFSVMVRGTAHLFVGGPPVVQAAMGLPTTKEELGGAALHTGESGSIDNLAVSEEDALDQIRAFLSYLPSNVHELAPRLDCDDPIDRREESLVNVVPRNPRLPYRMHDLLEAVVDIGSFFEIAPSYGRSRITGLARVNGYPVGLMANNPSWMAGTTDAAAAEKSLRLMQLCDTFHLPLVDLVDEPGFLVGPDSERAGIERMGARLVQASVRSRMPWVTVVVRRLYGVAGQCHHRPSGMYRRYAWPSAHWGSMPIEGGVMAAYKSEIESAPDPDLRRRQIEGQLKALTSPFRTAEATGQDIIDPRDTRELVAEFVEEAQPVLRRQLGTPSPLGYRP